MTTAEQIAKSQDEANPVGDVTEDTDITLEEEDGLEIEIVDDRPPEDRRDIDPKAKEEDTKELTDEEIEQLGKRAQDRIRRLKFEYHEERRQKEAAQRMADEAVRHTKRLQKERERATSLLSETQKALTTAATKRAEAAVKAAEERLQAAHEMGDPAAITAATKALNQAELAKTWAPSIAKQVAQKWTETNPETSETEDGGEDRSEKQDGRRQGDGAQPSVPEPDPKAEAWRKANPWFHDDIEMTSFAYGIHEKLIREDGVDPNSDEYYKRIDTRMRQVFPDRFEDDLEVSTEEKSSSQATDARPSPTVVASATRSNGAKRPRRVTLTATQVRIAKRLGLTPEQYARQLLKEQGNG